MSALSSIESDSLTSIPSDGEVSLACQARDKASCIRRHRVLWQRLIIDDDEDSDLALMARSSGKS